MAGEKINKNNPNNFKGERFRNNNIFFILIGLRYDSWNRPSEANHFNPPHLSSFGERGDVSPPTGLRYGSGGRNNGGYSGAFSSIDWQFARRGISREDGKALLFRPKGQSALGRRSQE